MKTTITTLAALSLLSACSEISQEGQVRMAVVAFETTIPEGYNDPITLGGYGSSMAYDPKDSTYYLLTDRGPNTDGLTDESKVFPMPKFAPTIGKFRLRGDMLELVEKITLKDSTGVPFTGIPNTEGDGVTGEVAYTLTGDTLPHANNGLDTEGLTLAPDGTFWVSDEYAPFIMQFDPQGVLLCKLSPGKGIPSYFANRRPNRGMEGITVSGDGKRLYGIMQSPLYLPNNSTKNSSVNNRILELEIATGKTREFIYTLDSPKQMVSEICWVDDSTMYVIERDGKFPDLKKEQVKRIYKIGIGQASDVSGRVIESLSAEELEKQGIRPVSKVLRTDILRAIPNYRHDKPEGIAVIDNNTIAIVNDDDFGVDGNKDQTYSPKLDAFGEVDHSTVYWIDLN